MTPFATWQLPFSVCLHFVLSRVCRNSYVQCRVSLWQSVTRQVQPTSRDVFVVYTVEQGAEPWKNQPFLGKTRSAGFVDPTPEFLASWKQARGWLQQEDPFISVFSAESLHRQQRSV